MKKKYLTSACCIVLISCAPAVFAATTSSIRYEQGSDDNDGDTRYLDVDLGLKSKHHLAFGYGKRTSLSGVETLTSDLLYIGFTTDPGADMSTGVTYTSLSEENSFNLDSIRLDLLFNTENWAFTLAPEIRNVEIYTTTGSTVTMLSPALGVVAGYYGIDRVSISVGHTIYSYEETTGSSSMRTPSIMHNMSTTSYDQAYGLDDYRSTFAASYNYGAGKIGMRYTRSVSAVDDAATKTSSVYVSYKFNETWGAELSTGTVDDSVIETRFVSLALGYYW